MGSVELVRFPGYHQTLKRLQAVAHPGISDSVANHMLELAAQALHREREWTPQGVAETVGSTIELLADQSITDASWRYGGRLVAKLLEHATPTVQATGAAWWRTILRASGRGHLA